MSKLFEEMAQGTAEARAHMEGKRDGVGIVHKYLPQPCGKNRQGATSVVPRRQQKKRTHLPLDRCEALV
jgi:hypothetical protein